MGLGNPGPAYENTYHNAGKLMTDYLSEIMDSGGSGKWVNSKGFKSFRCGEFILVKPVGYMNESGRGAKLALKAFGIKTDSLAVAHDDSDLEIGEYKISFGRGSAGHRGVQSVIESVGTKNFWRLRVGIRPKAGLSAVVRRAKAEEFVLKKITNYDRKLMTSVFEKASEEVFGGVN